MLSLFTVGKAGLFHSTGLPVSAKITLITCQGTHMNEVLWYTLDVSEFAGYYPAKTQWEVRKS